MTRWVVARWVLVAVWVVATGFTWWTAPRETGYEQARADIAAGRVVAYTWGDRWDDEYPAPWFGVAGLETDATKGPILAWRTSAGRTHWTDTDRVDGPIVVVDSTAADQEYSGDAAAGLGQSLRSTGVQPSASGLHLFETPLAWLSLTVGLTILAVLVAGPAPVLGTRWFWFWLIIWLPYGLGALLWLFRERPWANRDHELPGRRDNGFIGFALGLGGALVLSLVLGGLRQLLGGFWVPRTG